MAGSNPSAPTSKDVRRLGKMTPKPDRPTILSPNVFLDEVAALVAAVARKTPPCFKLARSGSVHHQRRNLARRIRGVLLEIIDCRLFKRTTVQKCFRIRLHQLDNAIHRKVVPI